jgi:hypothetical protein
MTTMKVHIMSPTYDCKSRLVLNDYHESAYHVTHLRLNSTVDIKINGRMREVMPTRVNASE